MAVSLTMVSRLDIRQTEPMKATNVCRELCSPLVNRGL